MIVRCQQVSPPVPWIEGLNGFPRITVLPQGATEMECCYVMRIARPIKLDGLPGL